MMIYFALLAQGLVVYIFKDKEKAIKEDIVLLKKKIEKIEAGEFVEKIVKNVIYSPESRAYFSSIFKESLSHNKKNDDQITLAILEHLTEIEKKLNEKK